MAGMISNDRTLLKTGAGEYSFKCQLWWCRWTEL